MLFMGNRKCVFGTSGASIIIALSMIGAIMFFTIGMTSTMLMAIGNTSDSKKAVQAEYAAQSGVELANLALKTVEPATAIDQIITGQCISGTNCESYIDYTVKGKDNSTPYITPYNQYKSFPIRGFGTAGTNCNPSSTTLKNPNDPCNWNKLYIGDSIELPLYVIVQENGQPTVKNFKDMGVSTLLLRVRVSSAYTIVPAGNNDTILNWQISGEGCLLPTSSCIVGPDPSPSYQLTDSNIKTQTSSNNVLLTFVGTNPSLSRCVDPVIPDPATSPSIKYIYQFVKDSGYWNTNGIQKPKFKMSYVKNLNVVKVGETTSFSVPYLEYQFVYYQTASTTTPLTATYKVNVKGFSNGFKFELNGSQGLGSGMFDFAVQN